MIRNIRTRLAAALYRWTECHGTCPATHTDLAGPHHRWAADTRLARRARGALWHVEHAVRPSDHNPATRRVRHPEAAR